MPGLFRQYERFFQMLSAQIFAISTFLLALSWSTGSFAQDDTSGSEDGPDFVIHVPVKVQNLHKFVQDVAVSCTARNDIEGNKSAEVTVVKSHLGVEDIDRTIDIEMTVRDRFSPDHTALIICELVLVITDDEGDDIAAGYTEIHHTQDWQKDNAACNSALNHWRRATCAENGKLHIARQILRLIPKNDP